MREDKHFETWVTSIFINECKRILIERKKVADLDEAEDAAFCEDSSNMELKEYLGEVDEMYREVIILKYISGYSQEEISGFLNIPIGTVKSRIYRGIQLLRESMKREVLE